MIKTPRLIIRPAALEDAPFLFQLNSDPEVIRFTGDEICKNIDEAQELITKKLVPQLQLYKTSRFLVFLLDGTFIGMCGLKFFPDQKEVDLGYRFLKKYWGKGYATEASQACLQWGFKHLKLNRIIAKVMPENIQSIKVLQKLNMKFYGINRDPSDPAGFLTYEIKSEDIE
ncbi:MAG: GNAT family N-acetyltransferase [Bacteriovoracaceae bacterium]